MSICLTTLYGTPTDLMVEVWAPDYDKRNFWLVYEDSGLEDRIDLSREQLTELLSQIEELLS